MSARITVAHANARLAATLAQLDTGGGVCRIRLYENPRIATLADTPTGAMLCELACDDPAGTVSAGVLTLALNDGVCAADGVATWALWVDGAGATVMDTSVGGLASDAEIKLANTTLVTGGLVQVLSATIG